MHTFLAPDMRLLKKEPSAVYDKVREIENLGSKIFSKKIMFYKVP